MSRGTRHFCRIPVYSCPAECAAGTGGISLHAFAPVGTDLCACPFFRKRDFSKTGRADASLAEDRTPIFQLTKLYLDRLKLEPYNKVVFPGDASP